MDDKIYGTDPNLTNPNNPNADETPVDPSNTSDVGQRVEQGVIKIKDGISEQSSEWEDTQERSIPNNNSDNKAGNYIKDPSPEENTTDANENG